MELLQRLLPPLKFLFLSLSLSLCPPCSNASPLSPSLFLLIVTPCEVELTLAHTSSSSGLKNSAEWDRGGTIVE